MAEPSVREFFARIPAVKDFQQLFDQANFSPVPVSWNVVLTDVQGSTQAIREGRYKDVNLVGAATIMAVLNSCKGVDVPYVFGGDGATLLIPTDLIESVRRALGGSMLMAKESFGLTLRAGVVPMADLQSAGVAVHLAKWALSPHLSQAIFRGGGVTMAEAWVKDPKKGPVYAVVPGPEARADFTGLECRWKPVPAKNGEAASVLVKAFGEPADQEKTYISVIKRIDEIYEKQERPFSSSDLSLAMGRKLLGEAKIRSFGESPLMKLRYYLGLFAQVAAGLLFFSRWGPKIWKKYRQDVPGNTDARKFDDMFRTVLEGTRAQHAALRDFLEGRRLEGDLVFGIHTSAEMLLTCLVFNRTGGHFHFVDGGDGGYALAAVELKKQLSGRVK